jgi:hypothetical protein
VSGPLGPVGGPASEGVTSDVAGASAEGAELGAYCVCAKGSDTAGASIAARAPPAVDGRGCTVVA